MGVPPPSSSPKIRPRSAPPMKPVAHPAWRFARGGRRSSQGPDNGTVAVHPLARVLPAEGQGEVDVELLEEELAEGGAVADVDPVADGGVLLLALALARDDVVVALGPGYGARQPDLLVGGLLVDHVGADVREDEGEDAGLVGVGCVRMLLWIELCHVIVEGNGRTNRVFHLDGLVLVGEGLELRQDDLEVRVGHLVVLCVGEIGGDSLDAIILDIGRGRVVGVGEDASVPGGIR